MVPVRRIEHLDPCDPELRKWTFASENQCRATRCIRVLVDFFCDHIESLTWPNWLAKSHDYPQAIPTVKRRCFKASSFSTW